MWCKNKKAHRRKNTTPDGEAWWWQHCEVGLLPFSWSWERIMDGSNLFIPIYFGTKLAEQLKTTKKIVPSSTIATHGTNLSERLQNHA